MPGPRPSYENAADSGFAWCQTTWEVHPSAHSDSFRPTSATLTSIPVPESLQNAGLSGRELHSRRELLEMRPRPSEAGCAKRCALQHGEDRSVSSAGDMSWKAVNDDGVASTGRLRVVHQSSSSSSTKDTRHFKPCWVLAACVKLCCTSGTIPQQTDCATDWGPRRLWRVPVFGGSCGCRQRSGADCLPPTRHSHPTSESFPDTFMNMKSMASLADQDQNKAGSQAGGPQAHRTTTHDSCFFTLILEVPATPAGATPRVEAASASRV